MSGTHSKSNQSWISFFSNQQESKSHSTKFPCALGCGQTFSSPETYHDHFSTCSKTRVKCNFCHFVISRDSLKEHYTICPNIEIECEYAEYGCTEKFLRCDKQEHLKKDAQIHFMMKEIKIMSQKISEIGGEDATSSLRKRSEPNLPQPSAPPIEENNNQTVEAQPKTTFFSNFFGQNLLQIIPLIAPHLKKPGNESMKNIFSKLNELTSRHLGNSDGMPVMVKLFILFIAIFFLKDLFLWIFRFLIFLFVCYANFKFLETTKLMDPDFKSYTLFGYGILVLYLMFIMV